MHRLASADLPVTSRRKRPAFQFYPGDWRRDTALQSCSLEARGLWVEMLCLMHDAAPYGFLRVGEKVITVPMLARMVGGGDPEHVAALLGELETAGVFSRADDGAIFSRRMIRDDQIAQARAAGGPKSVEHPTVAARIRRAQCRSKGVAKGAGKGARMDTDLTSSTPSFGPPPALASASAFASAEEERSRDLNAANEPEVIKAYREAWQARYGRAATVSAKDQTKAMDLAGEHAAADLVDGVRWFVSCDDGGLVDAGHPFAIFASQASRHIAASKGAGRRAPSPMGEGRSCPHDPLCRSFIACRDRIMAEGHTARVSA
jgi:hypothetical protein